MIQIKKTILTLVALLAVTTGAWADETPLVTITFGYSGPVYSESGIVTVTGSNADPDYNGGKYSWSPTGTISLMSVTVEPAAGYNITKVVFWSNDNGNYANALEDTAEPYVCYSKFSSEGKSLSDDLSNKVDGYNIAKIEVYGCLAEPPITVEPVEGKTNEWTFSMPGSDVLVDVEYKDLTAMALTFGGKAIPEAGVKGFLGFEQEFIDGLNLDAAVTNTDQNGAAVTTDATSYTYTSSDATVIGFKTATEGVYAQSGALADMEFRQEGSATLTIQYAGTEDLGKSAETVLLVTVTEKTYTVELADNTADADNWQGKIGDNGTYAALPVEGLKGSEKVVLKYDGSRIVKRVTATSDAAPAGKPVTLATALEDGATLEVMCQSSNGVQMGGNFTNNNGVFTRNNFVGTSNYFSFLKATATISGTTISINTGFTSNDTYDHNVTLNTTDNTYTLTGGSKKGSVVSVKVNGEEILDKLSELK